MNFQWPFRKVIAKISLVFFLNFILLVHCPAPVHAQERLNITGFAIKTPRFKPYREQGEFSFFLNRNASVNIEIQDKDFNLVRSIELMAERIEGGNIIAWDGKDEQGKFVKNGEYIFSVAAMAEDGTSAIISKDVEIELEAPMGTKFKPHIWEIEGEPKKEYPSEVPTKLVRTRGYIDTYCLGTYLFIFTTPLMWGVGTIGLVLSPLCLAGGENSCSKWFDAVLDIYTYPFSRDGTKSIWQLKEVNDPEEYAEIKQEIDEYNAEIDTEIALKNREIDKYNAKVKDSIVIKMNLTE